MLLILILFFIFRAHQLLGFHPKHHTIGTHKQQLVTVNDLGPIHGYNAINNLFRDSLSNNLCSTYKETNMNNIPTIFITDFGGDPYGVNDSTYAFEEAINVAITRYGSPNTSMSNGIIDLGGVTFDLGGGDYLISSPLLIPPMYGNLRFIDGTIRASNTFKPITSYLLNV
eukprot:152665_1